MSKKSKIANYILFLVVSVIEILCIFLYIDSLKAISTGTLEALAILATLPYFFIGTLAVFILSIIISIVYKNIAKNCLEANMPISKLDKTFKILPWLYLLVNIVLFAILYLN